ncbi:hypothetical protein SDC9_118954 [bioreactor metagenome]|uniref:Uncharacterized protein n=1 Tax=bioreactor metagenome TaxID=1076179 RepID=A0A645C2V5_9ZZZZ
MSGAVRRFFGVDKHLEAFITAEVIQGVFVNSTGIARIKIAHLQCNGLLILLAELRLARIEDTRHTRWQNVVHGSAVAVLFNIYG